MTTPCLGAPMPLTHNPPQNRISSLAPLILGAPFGLHTYPGSCWCSSWVPILYSCFHGPPLDLYCVATPSSHPCLEHPSWVIIAFMESILSPFVPRYSPPSLIAWFLSCVTHYGLQSHCPLSLMILCQSLPCHSCPLCSSTGRHPFATQSLSFHHHHWY